MENAFGVTLSPAARSLRRILLAAQNIQSHVLHLYFLALPEYLGADGGIEIAGKHPVHFKAAIALREFSDTVARVVGGRAVHPITPTVGGFHKTPSHDQLRELLQAAQATRPHAEHSFHLAEGIEFPSLAHQTEYFATFSDDPHEYPHEGSSRIVSTKGVNEPIDKYTAVIKEIVKDYSTAKFGEHDGRGFMVGALARMKLVPERLLSPARAMYERVHERFAAPNPYLNNLAQAIEINHFLAVIEKEVASLLENGTDDTLTPFTVRAGTGVGAVEAPRGTLYYELSFDENGIVTHSNIITPTVQNLTNIEDDANAIMQTIAKNSSEEEKRNLIEALIRAYDPCLSCSTH